jgi:hypothetical protein
VGLKSEVGSKEHGAEAQLWNVGWLRCTLSVLQTCVSHENVSLRPKNSKPSTVIIEFS